MFLALVSANRGLAAEPNKAQVQTLVLQASSLYAQGKLGEAQGKLETALLLDPYSVQARQLAAVVCQAARKPEQALEHYWAVQRLSWPPLPDDATEEQAQIREGLIKCEALVILLTNQERQARKLALLFPDPWLAIIARQHSEEMRDLNYFAHESPTPGYHTITDRFRRVFKDVDTYEIAENIGRRYAEDFYSLTEEGIKRTHAEWMNSPPHRHNILHPSLTKLGVGIAVNSRGDYWVTQFYARY